MKPPLCHAEGDISKDPPTQVQDVKLILSGKFLDSTKPLSGAFQLVACAAIREKPLTRGEFRIPEGHG